MLVVTWTDTEWLLPKNGEISSWEHEGALRFLASVVWTVCVLLSSASPCPGVHWFGRTPARATAQQQKSRPHLPKAKALNLHMRTKHRGSVSRSTESLLKQIKLPVLFLLAAFVGLKENISGPMWWFRWILCESVSSPQLRCSAATCAGNPGHPNKNRDRVKAVINLWQLLCSTTAKLSS